MGKGGHEATNDAAKMGRSPARSAAAAVSVERIPSSAGGRASRQRGPTPTPQPASPRSRVSAGERGSGPPRIGGGRRLGELPRTNLITQEIVMDHPDIGGGGSGNMSGRRRGIATAQLPPTRGRSGGSRTNPAMSRQQEEVEEAKEYGCEYCGFTTVLKMELLHHKRFKHGCH